ncbi:MAG TPA: proline--tRNA ligase [Candidatus Limivivens intestinipullorum]|uniref:Proline--tRNA ligase n=1 Tax=Candidatus Limivivens intestinipullorum TaxID=2840858 RepID=A0A9D1EW28_9FIRM|nr:proline--tRNA ligase [Candidatus Limivivens intestinipullorum]
MKLEKLVGDRFRERPSDCVVDSHAFMVRGGYLKYVANGIFSSYLPLRRVTRKIEQILREEMDAIDGQEVQFPVVMPAALWQESGRYESIGKELARFSDRNGSPLVLGMTHEEAAVQLVREYGQSYLKYPFMIYQIQTKFRDEARPRAGLIRVREFTMKDAYSFHTSQEDLQAYYEKCHKAYERIYERVGLPQVLSVASDSGMMGGSVSHEFMLLTSVGEDSIAVCEACGYRANMEAAECVFTKPRKGDEKALTLVETPDVHTIEELCAFLGIAWEDSCKAVVYQRNADDSYVVLFLRGDLDVNETKLTNYLGCEIHPAVITEDSGLNAGYIGPVNLKGDCTVLYDRSLEGRGNLACGANRNGYHYTGLDMERDIKDARYHDFAKIQEGGICPCCKRAAIKVFRGIEVGNIFQLGTKYTKSMNMTYVDEKGESHYPVMGCYGIGVGRLAAAVCEASHDEYGPIWPLSIAPWQVHLCAVRPDNEEVKACADKLYEELERRGVEVIYDDRRVSAGVMFADADLLGVPVRLIVSPRNLKKNAVEMVTRDKSYSAEIPVETAADETEKLLRSLAQG